MALRTRLVLVLVAVVAVALAVIEPVTYITTRQSLLSKVDGQLVGAQHPVMQELENLAGLLVAPPPPGTIGQVTYARLYSTSGQPGPGFTDSAGAAPMLPAGFLSALARSPSGTLRATAPGTHGVSSFRVLGTELTSNRNFPGELLVVAAPLTGVQSTLGHVLLLEVLVGLLVLISLAAASWVIVRLSLRPLEQMARTASEIAAGDLTARIDDTDERTEVGQLGTALNTMLSQIEHAFREKEASEEQLRRFVADASHELRTPLTSIRGYAELFRNGLADRPEDLAAALRRIESESTRMGGLVEDLLLLARLDQGRPLSREAVDLTGLAADAVRDAGVVDPSRRVTLAAAGPCVVTGDEARLRQLLGNLLSNALAYSPRGSPIEVQVGMGTIGPPRQASLAAASTGAGAAAGTRAAAGTDAGRSSGDGTTVPRQAAWIAVVDHGPGIPAENLAHIFDRFWRGDPSRVRASGGAGLGLSIVAAVVNAHGGVVSVEPTMGGGATFVVELPTGPVALVAGGAAGASAATSAESNPPPAPATDLELPGGSAEVTTEGAARR